MFKKLFGAKNVLSVPAHPYQSLPLLLVSGVGRSGTTILRKSFAAHSQIHANDMESNIIQRIAGMGWRSQQDQNIIKNMVVGKQKFWRLVQNLILHLHWPEGDRADRDIKVISTASSMTGISMRGLQAAFPNCLICYAVRNGIEVVSSAANFEPFKKLGFEHACREWNKHSAS